MGERKYKTEYFKSPIIIDKNTFEKVQLLLQSRDNKKDINRKYPNIFKGKIQCGNTKCGLTYAMHKRASGKDNAYRCLSKRYRTDCDNPSINIDKLNNAVYDYLEADIFLGMLSGKIVGNEKFQSLKTEIEFIDAEIRQIDARAIEIERQKKNLLKTQIKAQQVDYSYVDEMFYEFEEEDESLRKKLNKAIAEKSNKEEILQKLQNMTNVDLRNIDLYKNYVSDYLEYIRIHKIDFLGGFERYYTNKQDVQMLIEISMITGSQSFFIISQRTDFIIRIDGSDARMIIAHIDMYADNDDDHFKHDIEYKVTID